MSFPRYPHYKPSGVEWLGEVPEHWSVGKSRFYISILSGFAFQSAGFSDNPSDVKLLRGINVSISRLKWDDTVYWRREKGDGLDIYEMKAGELVIGMDRPIINEGIRVAIVRECDLPCLLLQRVACLKTGSRLMSNYIFYIMSTESLFATHFAPDTTGVSVPHISPEQIGNYPIPIPPICEQQAIAHFLCDETVKIDALVAEQQRLIELLKEKRQAVISHAVTKGLDPTVPMKPSGIEWLGDIPAHWKATALKRLARPGKKTFVDGDWIESPFICNDGIRLIQTGNIGIGYYKEQGYRYISESTFEELQCTEIFPRDVLICRLDGPVGRACLAPDLGVRMITSVDNAILKPSDDIFPEFVVSLLSSVPWIAWMDALCRVGGGFRLRVSRSQLGEILLPIPPFDEQVLIAQHLSTLATEWDVLTAEAERAIELLQERRTALISAAVTGQIDVRQLAQGVAA